MERKEEGKRYGSEEKGEKLLAKMVRKGREEAWERAMQGVEYLQALLVVLQDLAPSTIPCFKHAEI